MLDFTKIENVIFNFLKSSYIFFLCLAFIATLSIIRAHTEKDRTCRNMVCYQLYEPICAINQDKVKSDFANRCFMEIANCPLHGKKSTFFIY